MYFPLHRSAARRCASVPAYFTFVNRHHSKREIYVSASKALFQSEDDKAVGSDPPLNVTLGRVTNSLF